MNIQKLQLSHFRNYSSASFSFDPDTVHILYGKNAQGKTNLLEAIYFLSHLRSWRTSRTTSLIEHGEQSFIADCVLETKNHTEELRAVCSAKKKNLFRSDKSVHTFSSFVGILNAVLFSPDDLALFSAPPKSRRQFMDMEMVKLSRSYTNTLSMFQKLLKDRSAALKAWKPDKVLIEAITNQMISAQSILIAQRASFVKMLEEEAGKFLPLFSDRNEQLEIRYKTCADPGQDLKAQLEEIYKTTYERDLYAKTTSAGAHKDDLEFYLDGRLITQTASQGQRRSVMLALKLGLCEIIHQKTGQYPVLLLDDVFSELDDTRKARFSAALPEKMQIFITCAEPIEPTWFLRPVKFCTVDHGVIKEGIFDV